MTDLTPYKTCPRNLVPFVLLHKLAISNVPEWLEQRDQQSYRQNESGPPL